MSAGIRRPPVSGRKSVGHGAEEVGAGDVAVVTPSSLMRLRHAARQLKIRPGRIRAQTAGVHASPVRGRGMEFSESRPYSFGDDLRSLDWRVMARTGRPYTKLYRAERERPVLLWVDLRPPMFFGTRGVLKAVQAARIAALVGWSAADHGDRIGGIVFSARGVSERRPAVGVHGALAMVGALTRHAGGEQPGPPADLPNLLAALRHVARPGSLIFLISDLPGLASAERRHLCQLSRHSEVVLVGIHDPIEAELPPPGRYSVTDGRTEWVLDTASARARRAHRDRHLRRVEDLQDLCRRNRMHWIPCTTCDDPAGILRSRLGMPASA